MIPRIRGALWIALFTAIPGTALCAGGIEYLSPVPGAVEILPHSNIILRPGGTVDESTLGPDRVLVTGSLSGEHSGRLRLSDDQETIVFDPDAPFAEGERVTCPVQSGIKTSRLGDVPPMDFAFDVVGPEWDTLPELPAFIEEEELAAGGSAVRVDSIPSPPPPPPLPPDFPPITASVFGPTAPGRLFVANLNLTSATTNPYLMILNNDGTPFFQRKLGGLALDFKQQPDGRLTYFDTRARCFYALNPHYDVVDSFRTGNGYTTDGHDLVLLPNGHALLMSYDPEIVDFTSLGRDSGLAIGLIVQELDDQKEVVFQWRSWDHFQLTDAVGHNFVFGGVDYVHGNSLDVDGDGNILLSCRSMDEVTKIDRITGDILWRMGGKNNQFTFTSDPIPFSHQHAAKWLPNGNLVLFDNGNLRLPHFSRAVEYALDQGAKTATLVWQYRLNPDVFGPAFGDVQRLANGNTLICWGATVPLLTEVAPDGTIVSEMALAPGVSSYRAFRFEWPPVEPAEVTFQPSSLTKGVTGGNVLAVVEPVNGDFSVADVDLSTVRLQGTIAPATAVIVNAGGNGAGAPDLTVSFPRAAVDPLLAVGTDHLEVTGSLRTGQVFRGSGDVKVLAPPGRAAVRLLSPVGRLPVELAAGTREKRQAVAIYDIQGRRVTRLTPAGDGRVVWDGRLAEGTRAGAGIYFARVESETAGNALKLVILK